MQSVCCVLPGEYFERAMDARAQLCDEPELGAIYDPPFMHFTLQLADDYDWDGLTPALAAFARTWKPFDIRMTGLLLATGTSCGVLIAPYKDGPISEFHAAAWEVIMPFARGPQMSYEPGRWIPHVTVKRCETEWAAFGRGMARLANVDFRWNMTIDNISVQHDILKNNETRYQRLYYTLGETMPALVPDVDTNATILGVTDARTATGARTWTLEAKSDAGKTIRHTFDAAALARFTAAAKASFPQLEGARCHVAGDKVTAVVPNTPHPVM